MRASRRRGRRVVSTSFAFALMMVVPAMRGDTGAGTGADHASNPRTIVIGFDGMDPRIAEAWMADGTLPNFARLREKGHYQRLPTSNPAQSPVAWATFATGLEPGDHGIFDFLHRDPRTYGPLYSITSTTPPTRTLDAFGWRLPLDSGSTRTQRSGTAFWTTAERHGRRATVLRVPVTYPADPITRMLSGMGVPDLLGTQGTFTIYTSRPDTKSATDEATGARIVSVKSQDGRIETSFAGPMHPLREQPVPLALPMTIVDKGTGRVGVELAGTSLELIEGGWSNWVTLRFRFAGFMSVTGLVRLYLERAFPELQLYVSPIQIDPRDPVGPIASPLEYAGELAQHVGLYHTVGMAEETWSLNEEQISDGAYLDMVKTVLAEREAFLFDTLDRPDNDLVVAVFVQTDRVSHMFWRGVDPDHPLHGTVSDEHRNAIRWIYREADRILGRVLSAMRDGDRLIVLSDHGFSSFRRGVHLNRWLVDNGYMTLKRGQPTTDSLFANVDWTKTRAYAIGLNTLFLNRHGREGLGIVRDEDVAPLKAQIQEGLLAMRDPKDGAAPIATVSDGDELYHRSRHAAAPDLVVGYAAGYRASWATALGGVPAATIEDNAKKWSGDHLIEPSLVPGVLFTSFALRSDIASIQDVSGLVTASLDLDPEMAARQTVPSRGWLDFASPFLSIVDRTAGKLIPGILRIALWGALAAFLSMLIYKWTSNQKRLAELKAQGLEIQQRLKDFDGEPEELWPILGHNLSIAGRRLGLGLVPALLGSAPVLLILVWMSNAFDARFPPTGELIEVELRADSIHQLPPLHWDGGDVESSDRAGVWHIRWPASDAPITLIDSDNTPLLTLPTARPSATIHQRRWWNRLVGNPAGYLPSPGDVDAVHLGLPRVEVINWGPSWLRSWVALFFLVVIVTSLILKSRWRLH